MADSVIERDLNNPIYSSARLPFNDAIWAAIFIYNELETHSDVLAKLRGSREVKSNE